MAKQKSYSYLIVLNDLKMFTKKPLTQKEIKRLETIFNMRLVKAFENKK